MSLGGSAPTITSEPKLGEIGFAELGMVCHFNQCPKHKIECRVPGCGAHRFVQILPWFQHKPHRLNEFNSQILFQRPT